LVCLDLVEWVEVEGEEVVDPEVVVDRRIEMGIEVDFVDRGRPVLDEWSAQWAVERSEDLGLPESEVPKGRLRLHVNDDWRKTVAAVAVRNLSVGRSWGIRHSKARVDRLVYDDDHWNLP